jgi:ATP phosphoribosyltransferase regulatory subunit
MQDALHAALLPQGLHDLLPPDAGHEAAIVERALASITAHGYERVKPPLVEYEAGLLAGVGEADRDRIFRLLDPVTQRTMAVRADLTPQIARIAAARLRHAPRPLRLAYTGEVLRVVGDQLRPERQFRQVGCELIGSLEPTADAEIIALAAETALTLGIAGLTVDLALPTLVPALLQAHGITGPARSEIETALDRRDASVLAARADESGRVLSALVGLAGPVDAALTKFSALSLPPSAEPDRARLFAVVAHLRNRVPAVPLTVDPVERRGFEFQTGLSFTLFARGVRGELGRGGRYRVAASNEPAVGVTLFSDSLLRALPPPARMRRAFVPFGDEQAGARLREQGWITVAGLGPVDDARGEAKRLGCTHVWVDGALSEIA